MRTTCGGIDRIPIVSGLCLALALQGCISNTNYARPGADSAQLETDQHDCAQPGPVVAGVIAGGALGAVAGAGTKATGSSTGVAVLIGLLIAGAYGLTAAIISSGDVAEYDRCMQAKGYRPI